jgi:hypothetical protein
VFGFYAINNKHLIYKGKLAKLVQLYPGVKKIRETKLCERLMGNVFAGTV